MTDLKSSLLKLNKNLNILEEREAKYAGNAPLELLNQISDHKQAINLTEQAIIGEISEAELHEAVKPLLLAVKNGQVVNIEANTYIAGDVNGDIIGSDKVNGDKVFGDKIITNIYKAPTYHIPLQRPPRVENFTGRKMELAQLLTDLRPGRVVTLCGPGGIGKSALAAEAVWQLAPNDAPPELFPDGIIFHNFYHQPQSELALEQIARVFGEIELRPTILAAAQRALANRRALLILDGAEDADDLQAVLDVRGNCGVLVTSRQRKDAIAERLDLAPLPLFEAVTLLQTLGGKRAADKATAWQICELVDGLPLAVRLAGRYLNEAEEDAADFLGWLMETPLNALSQGQRRLESVPLLLERSITHVSSEARQVLAVVGLMEQSLFSREIIAKVLEVPETKARQMLGELINLGLLKRLDKHYEVSHALIHTYARQRMAVSVEVANRMALYYTAWANNRVTAMNHHTKINLQTIGGLLRMQSRRVKSEEARQVLDETLNRILSIAVIHELLSYESSNLIINIKEVSNRILAQLQQGIFNPEEEIQLEVTGDPIYLPARQATACSLIINELVQNAKQHGSVGQDNLKIVINLIDEGEFLQLSVYDDGCGFPSNFILEHGDGLGLHIVKILVEEDLRGVLDIDSSINKPGTLVKVTFPKVREIAF